MLLRIVVIVLLIILPCTSSDAASTMSGREKNDLIGPVRTVTTKGSGSSKTEIYDAAGNLLEVVIYLEQEKTPTRYLFAHNHRGNLLEENAYKSDGKLMYRNLFAYGYDSSGHETAVVAAFPDGAFSHAEFSTYDKRGYLTEKFYVNASGIYRNVFDVQGHIVYSALFRDGQLFNEVKFSYDSWGRVVELISYSPTGLVTGKSVNEYDDSGRRIRRTAEKFQQGAAGKAVTTYEYDSAGNWVKALMKNESGVSSETATAPYRVVQERVIVYYERP